MNCDNVINFDDPPPFVSTLIDPAGLIDCAAYRANVNGDVQPDGRWRVDAGHIGAFIGALIGA